MKLIEPSVKLIKQEPGVEGIYKQIERAGRICYKSEDKIVDCIKIDMKDVPENADENFWKGMPNYKENPKETIKWLNEKNIKYDFIESASKFVDMLINNGHRAMLEHGTVYLTVPMYDANVDFAYHRYFYNKYSEVKEYVEKEGWANRDKDCYYITTNFRVIYENGWLDDLQYICEPTEYHEKRYTLKFTTSIGITRELTRHRHMSFACESTRYCNYSKNKFGGEITFVKPTWVNIPSELPEGTMLQDGPYGWCNSNYIHIYCKDVKSKWFMKACLEAEYSYLHAINEQNATPQEAREMLPLATKSEIIMTGFESDWKDFFKLRCDKAAHPDMQIIANKAKELLKF